MTKTITNYFTATLFLFFLAALYGWFIRLNACFELPSIDYPKILQAHSHVAFLGWCYMTTTLLLNWRLLPKKLAFSLKYKVIFTIQLLIISLMLISFPIQGYKAFSIVLLSAYGIISYFYSYWFLKDYEKTSPQKEIALFVKTSIFYYILSTLGIWAIGPVLVTQGKGDMYFNTIYFYLHFLYNGFFVLSLLGLIFHYLLEKRTNLSSKDLKSFFWLTHIACIPTYALSLIASKPIMAITIIGLIGAILQVLSVVYLYKIIRTIHDKIFNSFSLISKMLLLLVLSAYFIKIILQAGSAFPQISMHVVALKSYFVVGYIHLVTLGIISSTLIFCLIEFGVIDLKFKLARVGIFLFFVGVLGTEILLFSQGFWIWLANRSLPYYIESLLIASSILVIGIFLISIGLYFNKNRVQS